MSIEFFTRLPLHGETQFLPGDPRNRGDWHRGGANSTGAVSGFSVGDHFTYIDYLGQIAKAAEINGFGGALMVNAPTGEEPWTVLAAGSRDTHPAVRHRVPALPLHPVGGGATSGHLPARHR